MYLKLTKMDSGGVKRSESRKLAHLTYLVPTCVKSSGFLKIIYRISICNQNRNWSQIGCNSFSTCSGLGRESVSQILEQNRNKFVEIANIYWEAHFCR